MFKAEQGKKTPILKELPVHKAYYRYQRHFQHEFYIGLSDGVGILSNATLVCHAILYNEHCFYTTYDRLRHFIVSTYFPAYFFSTVSENEREFVYRTKSKVLVSFMS